MYNCHITITIISVQDPFGSHQNGSHQDGSTIPHHNHLSLRPTWFTPKWLTPRGVHHSHYHKKQAFCQLKLVILNLCTIVHTFGQSVYNCVQIRLFCERKLVILNLCTIVTSQSQSSQSKTHLVHTKMAHTKMGPQYLITIISV